MSLADAVAGQQRRDILRLLTQMAPKFSLSNRLLYSSLKSESLYPPSQDVVDGHIAWLAQMLTVRTEPLSDDGRTVKVTLLQRGRDAAEGTADIPGIAAPEPDL